MAIILSPRDPARLAGLKQARYVMDCMINGQSKGQIVSALEGDEQLVNMWISFLKHNKWMEETSGIWSTTLKGTEWYKRMGSPGAIGPARAADIELQGTLPLCKVSAPL